MRYAVFLTIVGALLLLAGCSAQGGRDTEELAKCLTANGAKMYGAYWCPHCANQKKMFGASFKNVEYVECSLPDRGGSTEICIKEEIKTYPTWEFGDGTRVTGTQPLETLAERSRC